MLISYFGDLKYKSFNHEYITHKSSHQKYNCPKKITDHTLGWAFDNIFFSFSNKNGRSEFKNIFAKRMFLLIDTVNDLL